MLVNRSLRRRRSRRLLALAALSAAAACGESGPDGEKRESAASNAQQNAPAPGEPPLRRPTAVEQRLVPPRAVLGADPDPRAPALVFQSREKPEQLLDWFRATGNGADFALETELQEGAEHVFSGRVRATGGAYTVRIAPGANGGTTGLVLITDG